MEFVSDTTAPAHPAILEAMARANAGAAPSYGADAISARVKAALAELFETDVEVWLAGSGTAANALVLSVLCPSLGAIAAHEQAHIARDERGAVTFMTGGAQLALLPGADAKVDLDALDALIAAHKPDFVHETPLSALSLTNLTECGAAYAPDEIQARASRAKAIGLSVHVDGARFASAAAATGASPAALTWKAGADALSFGATKNGGLGCDAIVLFGEARGRIEELKARAKRAGHMPAKARYLAAQMEAYLANDLWLELAATANARARALADALDAHPSVVIVHPVDGNEVFASLPGGLAPALVAAGVKFHGWAGDVHRFVCSWATSEGEIAGVAKAVEKIRKKTKGGG
jgi:threonine aldolase